MRHPTHLLGHRTLGKTGLTISEFGFGAWAIGGNEHGNSYGPTDDAESLRALDRAFDLGCTFVDTADVYGFGHSEELVGRAAGSRSDIVVSTKVGGDFYARLDRVTLNFAPSYLRFACEKSLKRLRREAIDVYLLHNPPPQVVGDERLYEMLDILQAEGKIRAYGVSIHEPGEGITAIHAGKPQVIEVVLNLLHHPAVDDLLPVAAEHGVGIIAREPLANGFLAGKTEAWHRWVHGDIRHGWPASVVSGRCLEVERFRHLEHETRTLAQAAILYPLTYQEVSSVVVGCKTVDQVEENFGAASASPLDRSEIEARP